MDTRNKLQLSPVIKIDTILDKFKTFNQISDCEAERAVQEMEKNFK